MEDFGPVYDGVLTTCARSDRITNCCPFILNLLSLLTSSEKHDVLPGVSLYHFYFYSSGSCHYRRYAFSIIDLLHF